MQRALRIVLLYASVPQSSRRVYNWGLSSLFSAVRGHIFSTASKASLPLPNCHKQYRSVEIDMRPCLGL